MNIDQMQEEIDRLERQIAELTASAADWKLSAETWKRRYDAKREKTHALRGKYGAEIQELEAQLDDIKALQAPAELTDVQMFYLAEECGLDWRCGYQPLLEDGHTQNRCAVLIKAAIKAAHTQNPPKGAEMSMSPDEIDAACENWLRNVPVPECTGVDVSHVYMAYRAGYESQTAELADGLSRIRAQVAAGEKDAARYRCLQNAADGFVERTGIALIWEYRTPHHTTTKGVDQ